MLSILSVPLLFFCSFNVSSFLKIQLNSTKLNNAATGAFNFGILNFCVTLSANPKEIGAKLRAVVQSGEPRP